MKRVILAATAALCLYGGTTARATDRDPDYARYGVTQRDNGGLYTLDGTEITGERFEYVRKYDGKFVSNGIPLADRRNIMRRKDYGDPKTRYYGRNRARIVRIETDDNATRVTVAVNVDWDWQWFFFDRDTYLLDRRTGDRYMARGMDGDLELGRMNMVYGLRGKCVEQTLLFPRLPRRVRRVDLIEPDNYDGKSIPIVNTGGLRIYNIRIKKYSPDRLPKVIR